MFEPFALVHVLAVPGSGGGECTYAIGSEANGLMRQMRLYSMCQAGAPCRYAYMCVLQPCIAIMQP